MEQVENSTAKEGNLSKLLYKAMLLLVKVIPIVISTIYILNAALSYFYIDLPFLAYLIEYLFILFMYISSFTFRFCRWHRMFIHYILCMLTLHIYDYHIGIPIDNRDLLVLYVVITGVFLTITVYLKIKCKH